MRPAWIVLLCSMLAACGFRPMYGGRVGPELSSIYVEPIAERDGYALRDTLIDLLQSDGVKAGKKYSLAITLNDSTQGIALQNDATITRYNQTLDAKYVLTDAAGNVVTQGTQKELSAYNVVQSPYATLSAQQDSAKRAAQDMAERIRLALGAWFRQHRR